MSFPISQGTPAYSGNLIPNAIFSKKMLVKFYEATVAAAISNTDYEGEISDHGDKVIIRHTPDMVIRDYVAGQALETDRPSVSTTELLIDKGKYWQFTVDDVQKFQSDLAFQEQWTTDAAEQVKIQVDTDILGNIYADADASNSGTTAGLRSASVNLGVASTPLSLTKSNILDFIVDNGTVLDEQDVPENERKLVLPPWACALIKVSDLKDASLSGDGTSILRNGRVGMIDRFEIYMSNLLNSSGGEFDVIGCQRHALTFASQFVKTEDLRGESMFGTIFRGLKVYGYKVVKPSAMTHSVVDKG